MAKRGTDGGQTQVEGASPEVKKRIPWRRLQTRSRLLQAAYEVMSTKGVDAATIQEITDCAHVGFGTFYNYFKSKDEVAACLLDCIIQDMARRNELATESFKLAEPGRVMPVSVRLTLRDAIKDPVWRWWVMRPDLLSDRMRRAFEPFGTRDLRLAIKAGRYSLLDNAVETTWGIMVWMMVGALCDVISGRYPEDHERYVVEMITRVAGASSSQARELAADPLPPYPPANIDFSFDITQRELLPES
ncbi:TetR/AcrR family transcriptional regulator [Holophaga foetida]|uniref:TetR/AcrR family transcriptional regulator n=1 Tax=Holophaga foetida TaxID=35839 RepID=UPI000247530A|nr:TetR/AcrR family transcriptional regulator [Holophaga foetida]